MVGRRRAATAFRPSAPSSRSRAPSRLQTAVLLTGVLVVAAGITVASFAVKPDKARSFDLFYGSVFVDDNLSPVAIDLSSGKATVRLSDAPSAVSADRSQDLDMVPLVGGTLMLDPVTGEFNMLDSSGFVLKPTGGGVRLPQLPDSQDALTTAVPSGDSAYLVRASPTGTAIYLVGQSTVASAVGVTSDSGSSQVKARAQATLKQTSADDANTMTSANGDLFVLTGRVGTTRRLVQLSVPTGSNAGAPLTVQRRIQVAGVAALGSATQHADGTGADVVGVASRTMISVLAPDGSRYDAAVHAPAGVDAILPVRNAQGSLVFLYHAADSWSLVRAPIDGSAGASVTRLSGISAGVGLITPVESDGRVYAMGRDSYGSLFQVGDDGRAQPIQGAAHYPLVNRERLNLDGAEVTADGSRVIFDSRANFRAVVVFADGSHAPRIVDKHSAVQVDTNGTASVSGNPDRNHGPKPGKKTKPQPHPDQAINNKINCKVVSQTPHIPSVQLVQRASRSVQLQWEYPLLDPQDCDPSTYTVAVKLLSSDAPSPPSMVTVQGQDGVNLTGLFPDTEYQIVVSAYINKLHTPSQPLVVTTSVEGPAAPTGIHTTVDNAGNWTITWNSCGGIQAGCVATADWQIIPHLCDGLGLSSAPDTRRRVGDPTQHTFSFTYQGSETLLGRGLSFDIQGIGEKGTIGDSANDGSCSYSWSPVVAGDIHVHASAPPMTTGESTSHTTVSMAFDGGQQHDLGGVGGEMTYELLQGNSVVARVGPTTKPQATLPGISAGSNYQVAVVVNPARHPSATARIGPVDVQPAIAKWPQPSIAISVDDTDAYDAQLSVTVSLPPGTNTHGETFDLSPGSALRCGNTSMELVRANISAGDTVRFSVDRTQYNARCSVYVALVQNADTELANPLYGDGTTSPGATSGNFDIDVPTSTAGQSDFSASWNSSAPFGHPQINVVYTGGDPRFLTYARNWHIVLSNDGGTTVCGTSNADLNPGTTVDVDRSCVQSGGTFTAAITYTFYGVTHPLTADVAGSTPAPVDASKISFTASFVTPLLGRPQVQASYTGPYGYDTLSALRWTYSVTSDQSPGVECSVRGQNGVPSTNGPNIALDYQRCPAVVGGAAAIYTLHVSFTDPNYGTTGGPYDAVAGSPPP